MVCHRDTWKALDAWFGYYGDKPARVPRERIKDRGHGLVEVTLSGPSLVMLLKFTHRPKWTAESRALARRTYIQLAKVIDAV